MEEVYDNPESFAERLVASNGNYSNQAKISAFGAAVAGGSVLVLGYREDAVETMSCTIESLPIDTTSVSVEQMTCMPEESTVNLPVVEAVSAAAVTSLLIWNGLRLAVVKQSSPGRYRNLKHLPPPRKRYERM